MEPLLNRSVFRLRASFQTGQLLLDALRSAKVLIEQASDRSKPLGFTAVFQITSALSAFEAVLGSELSLLPLYVATQKAGFDMPTLIDAGANCFPTDVIVKAPDAVPDLTQGTKCIAFELYTAAGFHLHRANEAVLHRYWDAVSNNAKRPKSRNIGDYLREMERQGFGDPKVRSAIKELKDLHRNPLIHPEHSLETADQAIALMNSVHSVMVHMLDKMPEISPPPMALPLGATPTVAGSTP